MFVSSYNTYIGNDTSTKTNSFKNGDVKEKKDAFSDELSKLSGLKSHTDKTLPIDYVSNYKSFNTQQKLQEKLQNQSGFELKKLNIINNAKVAYEENTKMFSQLKKPIVALNLTPKIDERLPRDIKDAKEKSLRHLMVNTYLANNKYFEITAA
ncbi:MAG: hypothetical protein A2513_01525 [Sulfurimonas sp. RIFOXYD12_FULL_33_39]|uniref:hypothetical protein n=1 Tax=unclassified Sulfurimonas TaxID=2623549 RepID=UPI0008CFC4A5|nr:MULTISPECIES: hypothetical protein [unclassified Sulfurimonas]OHE06010.1 MAG: hypothetical protein A3G74_00265 [Sulfurimonas sp. RIFCSPLOWO2_12_FULL_34_6]OHE08683.1 MAG: hypothetical protein A2513_01525 [Sulfurimonas sp. RIFOXYD12_FULL_33_39]OHE13968.1 MAG: hypothetical protein A2530_02850 [Sulfurimonas sp. RIFOXYD2_FULL_34_21]